MKLLSLLVAITWSLFLFSVSALPLSPSGFFLPDSVNEVTLRYKTVDNLVVLPVKINDSVSVNLILDTGCRNLVLFGRRFERYFTVDPKREVQFSGLGSGRPVVGSLSLNNRVSIEEVLGNQIPIVIVPNKNVFMSYPDIDGVIGYEIFFRFEIELDPSRQLITFRPSAIKHSYQDYVKVPMEIIDCRPVIRSQVEINERHTLKYDLIIDTGSVLGLLVKTKEYRSFEHLQIDKLQAFGFNGPLHGLMTLSDFLHMPGFSIAKVPTGIISSPWHDHASIGMKILKDYSVILNYFQGFVCLKPLNRKTG